MWAGAFAPQFVFAPFTPQFEFVFVVRVHLPARDDMAEIGLHLCVHASARVSVR